MTLVLRRFPLSPLLPSSLPFLSSLPSFNKCLVSTYSLSCPVVDIGALQSTRMSWTESPSTERKLKGRESLKLGQERQRGC